MTLDDITADKTHTMTPEFVRMFRAAGCDPTCHCCYRKIRANRKFKLASIDGTDEMLCYRCTPKKLQAKLEAEASAAAQRRMGSQYGVGGYSRPSRVK